MNKVNLSPEGAWVSPSCKQTLGGGSRQGHHLLGPEHAVMLKVIISPQKTDVYYGYWKYDWLSVFSICSRKPLIATVEKQLLGEHLTATLQKGTSFEDSWKNSFFFFNFFFGKEMIWKKIANYLLWSTRVESSAGWKPYPGLVFVVSAVQSSSRWSPGPPAALDWVYQGKMEIWECWVSFNNKK